MGKRSVAVAPSHKELAKKLAKRGQQSYYIIAVDHIQVSRPCRRSSFQQ